MRAPNDELRQKLESLARYADELEDWLANPPDPSRGLALQRIVERLIQVIVECAADAGDLWLADRGHHVAASMRDVFRRLEEVGAMSAELGRRFADYTRTRNRIVHDYDIISAAETLDQAPQLIADVRTLLRSLTAP